MFNAIIIFMMNIFAKIYIFVKIYFVEENSHLFLKYKYLIYIKNSR